MCREPFPCRKRFAEIAIDIVLLTCMMGTMPLATEHRSQPSHDSRAYDPGRKFRVHMEGVFAAGSEIPCYGRVNGTTKLMMAKVISHTAYSSIGIAELDR